jgi:CHASE2 domain-containing sensor protein
MTKKIVISLLIALLTFVVTFLSHYLGFFEKPEHLLYDVQAMILRSDKAPDSSTKVILVDEASLKSMATLRVGAVARPTGDPFTFHDRAKRSCSISYPSVRTRRTTVFISYRRPKHLPQHGD